MASRYQNRRAAINNLDRYKKLLENRGVNFVRQYTTPRLKYPSVSDIMELSTIPHIWKTGDRYFKLAHQYTKI